MEQGIKKLYYSISEVSEITDLKPYVLRYWETEFKQLAPPKNRAGNRTYRQKDIDLILKLKRLLHQEKFTIEGARKQLLAEKFDQPEAESLPDNPIVIESKSAENCQEEINRRNKMLNYIRRELESLLELLQR